MRALPVHCCSYMKIADTYLMQVLEDTLKYQIQIGIDTIIYSLNLIAPLIMLRQPLKIILEFLIEARNCDHSFGDILTCIKIQGYRRCVS